METSIGVMILGVALCAFSVFLLAVLIDKGDNHHGR